MKTSQERQTAVKAKAAHLVNGSYVVREGWEPNYVLCGKRKISRANILGAVVAKNQDEFSNNSSIVIDDGSGRISARVFEPSRMMESVAVGDLVLVIGRPREYNNEIYLVPEIIRKVEDKRWAEVRMLETEMIENFAPETPEKQPPLNEEPKEEKDKGFRPAEETQNKAEQKTELPAEQDEAKGADAGGEDEKEEGEADAVLKIIRDLDSGSGADIEKVTAEAGGRSEEIINGLLKNGDVFELTPGKIKVLE